MLRLKSLSRDGAVGILHRLCLGEARFGELSEAVANTRTLTKRLKEMMALGLIEKAGSSYKITGKGFEAAVEVAEFEGKYEKTDVNYEELAKIQYGWMRVSLMRLIELFAESFGGDLVSLVLYGSVVEGSFQLGRSDVDVLYILEDDSEKVWQCEREIFKDFQSTWEYKACDYLLRTRGTYGYPEVTTVWLQKSFAKKFQLVYLDMLSQRAVLYDKEEFFQKLMRKLKGALEALATVRIERADGTYSWFLKPDLTPGELIEICLG